MAAAVSTTTTSSSTDSKPQRDAAATLLTPAATPSVTISATSSGASTPNSKPACSTCPTHLLKSLKRDGYVHIPSLVDPVELSSLRAASIHATELARAGKWPHIRNVPKQFPPWAATPPPDSEGGIWGVQHLLHPDMPDRKRFAKLYFSNKVTGVVKELLGLNLYDPRSDDNVVMELFNLLVSPSGGKDFELRWHRDDIKWEVDAEEEKRQLDEKSPGGRQAHTQYNISLFDEESLIVIPGSHRRVRTDVEREADPLEPNMPDQLVVKMKAGDAVFYDSNILHRGTYKGIHTDKGEVGRMTLHGSVSLYGHSEERAKNVLQHGVGEWVSRRDASFDDLVGKCKDRAEGMRLRLIEMGKGDELGYSLDG